MTTTHDRHAAKGGDNTAAAVPQPGDAFGQMLLAAQVRAGMATHVYEVTERDDAHISARDAYHYFLPVHAGSWEHILLSTITGRTLDIGCGAGRHSRFLGERGITALGIDVSLGAVQVCAERGIEAVHGDIRKPANIGRFDAFLLLGGNLGLLGTPQTAPELLHTLGAMANPGARLLAHGIDLSATTDPLHLAYQERNRHQGRHPGQVRMRVRHRLLAGEWTELWFPSADELGELASATGWELSKVHQDETAGFYAVMTLGRSTA